MAFELLHPSQQKTLSVNFPSDDSNTRDARAMWLYPFGASLTDSEKTLEFLRKFESCKEINIGMTTPKACEWIRKDPKPIIRLSSMSGYITVTHASKTNSDIIHTRIKVHADGVCKPLPPGHYYETINCRTDGELLMAIYSIVFTDEYTRDSFAVINK